MKENDTISRQAAIEAICKACSMEGDYHKCDGYHETSTWCDYLVALRALPTAEKKGRWVDGQCSNCGCDVPAYIIDWKWQKDMEANYCPNCGARMEE